MSLIVSRSAPCGCFKPWQLSVQHSIFFFLKPGLLSFWELFWACMSPCIAWRVLGNNNKDICSGKWHSAGVLSAQVETEGLRRSIQNLGVLLTTAAVAHTSVATGEGLRHAATGQHHTITVTTKDKVLTLNYFTLTSDWSGSVCLFAYM